MRATAHIDTSKLLRDVGSGPLVIDLIVAVPLSLAWLRSFEVHDRRTVAVTCAALFLLRLAAWLLHAWRSLAGVDTSTTASTARLQFSAGVLHGFAPRHARVYASSWALYPIAGTSVFAFTGAGAVTVERGDWLGVGMLALGVGVGFAALVRTHTEVLLEHVQLELGERLREHPSRPGGSGRPGQPGRSGAAMVAATRLGSSSVLARRVLGLTLGPMLVVGGLAWPASPTPSPIWPALGLTATLVAWSLLVAWVVERRFGAPLRRTRDAVSRVAAGTLWDLAEDHIDADGRPIRDDTTLRVGYDDELGALALDLDAWLATQRQLVKVVETVASGQLAVEIEGQGDLAVGLRRMVELVNEVIQQIRMMARELAASAVDIELAARDQARATEQQRDGMTQIVETLAMLTQSSAQISHAVQNVFANAESTLATTDELAATFAELDRRNQSIGELLEVVREIANRSDLLSLNGALEATRVGDAGAGFSLIAEEMRRLAERVTRIVVDVRAVVRDIRDDSSTTVDLTELGRELAEGTSIAAREIAGETERQTAETASASQAVRELADYVTHTGSSALRTRELAEQLQFQARQLEALTRGFGLDGD